MGARPSSFKAAGGGGFLKNVDGVITGLRWTDEFNGNPFVEGRNPKTGKDFFHSLNAEVSILIDGAEDDITQTLFAGGWDNFVVSDDGKVITPVVEGYELGRGTPWDKFIGTLCAPGGDSSIGFPEDRLPEDGEPITYEAIVGTRVRFGQEAELDANGKPKMRLVKTGPHKGKSFPITTTIILQVYDLPGKKKASAPATKGKAGKAAPEAESEEDTLTVLAVTTLVDIVSANKGKMLKSKLAMAILAKMMKHPLCEKIRKLVTTDEFLSQEAGWSYNAKTGAITVEVE